MAVLMVSGVVENDRATSERMGLSARPLDPTTLTANIRAGTGLRVLRFCIPEFYLNKIRVYTDNPLFHKV